MNAIHNIYLIEKPQKIGKEFITEPLGFLLDKETAKEYVAAHEGMRVREINHLEDYYSTVLPEFYEKIDWAMFDNILENLQSLNSDDINYLQTLLEIIKKEAQEHNFYKGR